MQVQHSQIAVIDPNCEIRFGDSSWNAAHKSGKYAWKTVNGGVARGGEFPVEALPQFVEMAIRLGYIDAKSIVQAVANAL